MIETCAVCKKGKGPKICEECGFSHNGFINKSFLSPEDFEIWVKKVVKPYRKQWRAKKNEEKLWEQGMAEKYSTFTDYRDGKMYKTIKIGEQIWMAENLAYVIGGKYYKDEPAYGKKYRLLYEWKDAMKACPEGWHLPSNAEWKLLVDLAGGEKIAGKKLKARSGWNHPDGESGNGTDDFGFAALPGGGEHQGYIGVGVESLRAGCFGCWWSGSLCEEKIELSYNWSGSSREDISKLAYSWEMNLHGNISKKLRYKWNLFSVRCVKN